MPRGVKGSGKPKTVSKTTSKTARATKIEVEAVTVQPKVSVENKAVKTRKTYPSYDERIAMADQQIDRLTKLNASREALVAKTERLLAERRDALMKSTTLLAKTQAKRERLVSAREMPKMTADEIAAAKAAKKQEQEKLVLLAAALKQTGKSVDELLAELQAQ